MNGFSYFLFLGALWFGFKALLAQYQRADARRWREGEIERTRRVVERDASNSGTRAKLAAFLIEDGELEAGIHEYRTAIAATPSGPFATEWKRKLRDALEVQEKLARGERIPGFNELRTCEKCQATVSARTKICPRCGTTLHVSFWEWITNADTQRDFWREGIPLVVVLLVVAIVVSSLSPEWKGALLISSVIVGGWLALRSFDV